MQTADITMTQEACMSIPQMKMMLITFFDIIKGIVHFEFIPQDQSTRLTMWKYCSSYMKLCVAKGLNLAQWLDSPTCPVVSGPKINC
jgi:hypothetical protein